MQENEEVTPTTTTPMVKVGKLDIGNMFGKEPDQMTGGNEATDQRRVGKLKLEVTALSDLDWREASSLWSKYLLLKVHINYK